MRWEREEEDLQHWLHIWITWGVLESTDAYLTPEILIKLGLKELHTGILKFLLMILEYNQGLEPVEILFLALSSTHACELTLTHIHTFVLVMFSFAKNWLNSKWSRTEVLEYPNSIGT